ncbi:hypothetical protein [Hymenobacter tenuis]
MMKKITKTAFGLTLMLGMSLLAYAGEQFSGNGPTKEAAADAAERRAAKAAKARGTCYSVAKLEDCVKESDGSWTCYSSVANHKGSCDGTMLTPN